MIMPDESRECFVSRRLIDDVQQKDIDNHLSSAVETFLWSRCEGESRRGFVSRGLFGDVQQKTLLWTLVGREEGSGG